MVSYSSGKNFRFGWGGCRACARGIFANSAATRPLFPAQPGFEIRAMFIPYGDDIEKRHPPFATIFLMAVNVLVCMYAFRLFQEGPNCATKFTAFIDPFRLVPHALALPQ